MKGEELLMKMYGEIMAIKSNIEEIKSVLIPEDKPMVDELREIELGIKEIETGKYRKWRDIREEI